MPPVRNVLLAEDDIDDPGFFIKVSGNLQNVKLCGLGGKRKEAPDELAHPVVIRDTIFLDRNTPLMNVIECLYALKNTPRISHILLSCLQTAIKQAELCCRLNTPG